MAQVSQVLATRQCHPWKIMTLLCSRISLTFLWKIYNKQYTNHDGNCVFFPVKKEYCATEKFDASCDPGHVILIRSATYGRMRPGRCIGGVSLGCQVDILGHLDSVCSGRTSCHLSINDLDMVAQPCAKDYKSYLEATHICVPGMYTARKNIHTQT